MVREQRQDPEHEMHHHLRCSAYHDVVSTELLLYSTVEPLNHCALIVSHRLVGCHWNHFLTSRVLVDERNMPQAPADLIDRPGIIGCVHQVIQVIHLCAAHLHQGYGDLAVMDRGRRQCNADRKPAIIHIGVKLVADPGFLEPFRVLLQYLPLPPLQAQLRLRHRQKAHKCPYRLDPSNE